MANEIITSVRAQVTNGAFKDTFNPNQQQIDQTGVGYHAQIVSVSTSSPEAMPIGDITIEGIWIAQNLDSAVGVTYGPYDGTSMHAFGRLEPGEATLLRLSPSTTVYWQSDGSGTEAKVEYRLYED